jgi:hypothetical protein
MVSQALRAKRHRPMLRILDALFIRKGFILAHPDAK